MSIKAKCRAYRDHLRTQTWPPEFVALPRVGDLVESMGGQTGKVLSITHCYCDDGAYIEVELTDPSLSLTKVNI